MARIAIVDDSRLARTFTVSCLKKLGHELLEVEPSSLFDVIKLLRENPPDLVLMDYLMPNCSGTSLVRAFREDPAFLKVRILMISAHRDEELVGLLSRLGVDDFLSKPFEPQTLVKMVEFLLNSRE
jgi:DNA-binding response OmpR family regulator